MTYECKIAPYKFISSGYPCEGWLVRLSARNGEAAESLNALAKAGDKLVTDTAEWLAEMYGDTEAPPEALFTDAQWSSVEIDEDTLEALSDELARMGWQIIRQDAAEEE